MQSEPAFDSREAVRIRCRRRKHGGGDGTADGTADGPVFVDNSGRRSKLLRRVGVLLGIGCLAYAAVLGAAFMGWGTSLTPSSLLPFGGGQGGGGQGDGGRPGGFGPAGGAGAEVGAPPTGAAFPSPSTTASPSAG
ncbi:hypothetical protein [Streptomyces sp. Amel2xC10]|uniref:hypothetical protein n=1 Tax=Streptomyces sp. Amel2xC10 TaxID=1305826 RepID=UPI002119B883|nr:hypothetical protein [Streptomyces sp. Amel2xC10]